GVPELPAALVERLAPYLETRRVRIAAVDPAGPALLVLTRTGATVQVHRVDAPGAPPRPLTDGPDPVQQAVLLTGRSQALLLRRDRDGDERHQIYRVWLDDGREELLTDGESRHGPFRVSRTGVMAFTSDKRDPESMDVYLSPARGAFAPRLLLERQGQW